MNVIRKILKVTAIVAEIFFAILIVFFFYILSAIRIPYPDVPEDITVNSFSVEKVGENHWVCDDSWLRLNSYGVWEVYIAGNDYERGIKYGLLTKDLMEKQEDYFVAQINEIIPNSFFLNFLKIFVGYFNKDMTDYIPVEYQREIYGVSLSFSDKYDYIAPKYYRILNYHAAHDIGHALKDLNMVGCTSFSAQQKYTRDSSLIVGRNFDFYMGEDFSKDKLITFMNPEHGYKYISYSWAGLMGVVSGMNEMGLTVTINASKSDIPTGAKTPISLLAREILQYAKNHEEAIAIAKKREVFVSETIMVASAIDGGTILMEKSPDKFDVYSSGEPYTICANHYQSKAYENDANNISNLKNSDSKYRFNLMDSLVAHQQNMSYTDVAQILRFKDDDLGMGNPKLINQMIAHHACIFKPQELLAWFSTAPYQMGPFVCYDLHKVFQEEKNYYVDSLLIPADPFIQTPEFEKYQYFVETKSKIVKATKLGVDFKVTDQVEANFIESNPNSYITYMVLGEYFMEKENKDKALYYFNESLKCSLASVEEKKKIENLVQECQDL